LEDGTHEEAGDLQIADYTKDICQWSHTSHTTMESVN